MKTFLQNLYIGLHNIYYAELCMGILSKNTTFLAFLA